jgi:cyanophycinase
LETPPVDPTPTGFKAQDLPRVIAWLSQLDGLYFTGGDQNRLLTIFQQHPEIPTQIRKHYESGLLAVAGTSAGTAIQGSRVFTGNEDLTVIQPETLDLQPGLALLPEAIVDQHFLRRQRHNRMLSALQAQPRLVGVGVDEDTALILESQRSGKGWTRRGRVHGRGQALLFTPKAGSNGKQLDLLISPNLDCLEWSTDTSAPKTRGCD